MYFFSTHIVAPGLKFCAIQSHGARLDSADLQLLMRTKIFFFFFLGKVPLTCEGALQDSPPVISPMRAAAVGLLELMSTGPLISMEWRCGGGASAGLWDMVREVKECRFLLFFFSPARWAPLLWGPEEAPSPESPLESDDLSNSIS